MPIYEKKCPECGKVLEVILAIKDMNEVIQCPVCGCDMVHLQSCPAYCTLEKSATFKARDNGELNMVEREKPNYNKVMTMDMTAPSGSNSTGETKI